MPQKQDNGDPGRRGPATQRPHRASPSPDVSWPARRVGPQPQTTGERQQATPESASGEDHIADASDVGSGAQDLRAEMSVDPPQPSPRDYSGGGKPIRPKHHDSRIVEETSTQEHQENSDDGTGGDAWNRVLGNTTNAGMLRLLAAIGLFILVSGAFFWLVT